MLNKVDIMNVICKNFYEIQTINFIFKDEIAVLEISDPWSGLDPFKMMLIKGIFIVNDN